MSIRDILKKLVSIICVSGYESFSSMRLCIEQLLGSQLEAYGSNYVIKVGDGLKKVLIMAHMDEVGFILTKKIATQKYLALPIGSVDVSSLNGRTLEFLDYGSTKSIKSRKLCVESDNSIAKVAIEIEENVTLLSVGSYERSFDLKNSNIAVSPALDNRVGCTALIETYKSLGKLALSNVTIYFAFVGREETGANGFINVLNQIQPDFVIDIDSAYANPITMPEERENWVIPDIGKGPALQLMGKEFILDVSLRAMIEKIALLNNIPLQYEVVDLSSGGTNSRNALLRGFNPVQLNIPVRFQHKAVSEVCLDDIDLMVRLLTKIVEFF